MDLSQLRCFVKVAELQHMTRAAHALSLSQPALSKTIRLLEEEFGVALFERRGKHIYLTDNGRLLLKRAYPLLSQAAALGAELRDSGGGEPAPIRLAARGAASLIPGLITGFRRLYPAARFDLRQDDDVALRNGEYDLLIGVSPMAGGGENSCLLLEEEICAAMPEGHPLAKRRRVTLEELATHPMIGLGGSRMVRTLLQTCLQEVGLAPDYAAECDDILTIRNLVRAGLGCALVPALALAPEDWTGVRLVPLRNGPKRLITLSWKPDAYLSPTVRAFRAYVLRHFEELHRPSL